MTTTNQATNNITNQTANAALTGELPPPDSKLKATILTPSTGKTTTVPYKDYIKEVESHVKEIDDIIREYYYREYTEEQHKAILDMATRHAHIIIMMEYFPFSDEIFNALHPGDPISRDKIISRTEQLVRWHYIELREQKLIFAQQLIPGPKQSGCCIC